MFTSIGSHLALVKVVTVPYRFLQSLGFNAKIFFIIGLEIGGSGYERLNDAILRMIACAVVIKKGTRTYMGSLIGGYDVDEYTKVYRLDLNRHLVKLFGDNDWTAINWEQRKQLRNKPLCLKLHDYYSSHENPFPITLEFLSDLAGSVNKQKADFKRQVKTALEELIKIDFLKSYSIEKNIVKVERTLHSTK